MNATQTTRDRVKAMTRALRKRGYDAGFRIRTDRGIWPSEGARGAVSGYLVHYPPEREVANAVREAAKDAGLVVEWDGNVLLAMFVR